MSECTDRDFDQQQGANNVDFEVVDLFNWDKEMRQKSLCAQADQRLIVAQQAQSAGSAMKEIFDQADADGNGFITIPEIDKLLAEEGLNARQRQALKYMKTNYELLESASNDEWGPENDGVTKADLNEFETERKQAEAILRNNRCA